MSTTWYRNGDVRYPFGWATTDQPPARWHAHGRGPACYLANTPDGAWAEFLRHEEISDPADLASIRRRLWAVEVPPGELDEAARPGLDDGVLTGGVGSHPACQVEADRLRRDGAAAVRTPSAALVRGGAGGQRGADALVEAPPRDGEVLVLFGARPGLRGWAASDVGSPTARVLARTVPLAGRGSSERPIRR